MNNHSFSTPTSQKGFTLLELLIALLLTMVLLVGIQRYLVNLVIDQESISEHQGQATQIRIALSNMKRDIAQAGYFPYASDLENTQPLGIFVQGNTVTVNSYQPKKEARDCNGSSIRFPADEWVYVQNVYALVNGSLTCNGNGGNNGRMAVLDHVLEMSITPMSMNSTPNAPLSMVSVCLVFTGPINGIGGTPTTTKCNNIDAVPTTKEKKYYKIRVDMPVHNMIAHSGGLL